MQARASTLPETWLATSFSPRTSSSCSWSRSSSSDPSGFPRSGVRSGTDSGTSGRRSTARPPVINPKSAKTPACPAQPLGPSTSVRRLLRPTQPTTSSPPASRRPPRITSSPPASRRPPGITSSRRTSRPPTATSSQVADRPRSSPARKRPINAPTAARSTSSPTRAAIPRRRGTNRSAERRAPSATGSVGSSSYVDTMIPAQETAALIVLLRQGHRTPRAYADLLEETGSALEVLERELSGDDGQISLLPPAGEGPVADAMADIAGWRPRGISPLTLLDPDYPENLRAVHDRPPLIFVAGGLDLGDARSVAVIGSRRASRAGIDTA